MCKDKFAQRYEKNRNGKKKTANGVGTGGVRCITFAGFIKVLYVANYRLFVENFQIVFIKKCI